jgi:hypothetical protein
MLDGALSSQDGKKLPMVPGAGIEPARLAAGDFESPASTNFTTRARERRSILWHNFRPISKKSPRELTGRLFFSFKISLSD